ncbi:polysaccharide biosynthesis protein [Flavobacterium sp. '19STA2R22 D10 B1']|uniref:polysaccharide biosynthesis protein n=1 Tax=Flavobacterium aerium TaxID=3037261 RepID=UPI00278C0EC4|nr:nucleoside-diphosphate sugar epimerase/dehydratase [Flavobacterium sp. '19STA2R22 D10 B1']
MNHDQNADIKSVIKQMLSFSKSTLSISNLDYLPRWIILMLDMTIVFGTGIVTNWLLDGMGLNPIRESYMLSGAVVYLLVNLFFFRVFRIYSGIIRHSSFIDAVKIFFSQMGTLFVFLVINFVFLMTNHGKIFLNTGLFLNFVLSFCALFSYRIMVKQVFERYFNDKKDAKLIRAMIYGSDANAIAVANALRSEVPTRFKLVAFINKNNHNTSKRILDLPILYQNKKVSVLMRSKGAEALIIADKSLTKEEQLVLVDECLEFGYNVYTVPLITDWENKQEISKKVKNFQIEDLLERKPITLDSQAISKQIKDKTVLITGAAGSIGSEIVWQVIGFNPAKVIVLDQAETPLHNLFLEIQKKTNKAEIYPIIADIRNKQAVDQVFKQFKPDVVYHAAAYKHVPLMEENPAQAVYANVMGTKNIADLAYQYKVSKFVMVSTDKAVNPSNVMGASKRIAEKYVQALHFKCSNENGGKGKTKYITTRFGNVLGSNGSVVPLFTKQIASGGPITITHPDIIRYFMTIPEACQLVLEAGAMGNGGEIYIFDMGKPVKIIDLAYKMIRLAGFIPDKEIKIKIVGLRPGEKLYEELLNNSSKTLPTHHNKIMIAQEMHEEFEILNVAIEALIHKASSYDNHSIVTDMKKLVPEFKSMNSTFEKLD